MLESISDSGAPVILVFDGVDEAKNDQIIKLTERLVTKQGSRTRIILLSRPIKQFDRRFWGSRRVILQQENGNDIQEIIKGGIA